MAHAVKQSEAPATSLEEIDILRSSSCRVNAQEQGAIASTMRSISTVPIRRHLICPRPDAASACLRLITDASTGQSSRRSYSAQAWLILRQVKKSRTFPRIDCSNQLTVAKLLAVLLFVCLSFPLRSLCATVYSDIIRPGFSASAMSYVDNDGAFLYSESSSFSLVLYSFTGNSDVYLNVVHTSSNKVVWTANRDSPASRTDTLNFLPSGNLVFMTGNGSLVVWSTKTRGATLMQMQETGNLVLLDAFNNTVWQSFDNPSDTLLSGQVLLIGGNTKLVSSRSATNLSSGSYTLTLKSEDLQLLYSPNSNAEAIPYWSMLRDIRSIQFTSGAPSLAVFNNTELSLVTNKSALVSSISWKGTATLSRATLETDGNLKVYAFSNKIWALVFASLSNSCDLPDFCGKLGVCNGETCTCPGILQPVKKGLITEGCQGPSEPVTCSKSFYTTIQFEKIADSLVYFANQFIDRIRTSGIDECKNQCSRECNCSFLFFHNQTGYCYLYDELQTLKSTSEPGFALYMKTTGPAEGATSPSTSKQSGKVPVLPIIGITASAALVILLMIGGFGYFRIKRRALTNRSDEITADDDDVYDAPSGPTRFSFQELRMVTNNFSEKIGAGGFGSVYKGLLPDQTKVAVKKLESMGQGRKEFRAEVGIIGSIHHAHLVRLHGYCADALHKLLVYEFMSQGSLHRCLFESREDSELLDWNTRHRIALGTARGLAYLHNDCRETILHCDIKPENILLDDNFTAKISDLGLAKLLSKEQSQAFTTMRGTRGYLAPEWLLNLPISDKSDVYSFGMVLLEIISGRKNHDPSATSEKCYLPAFAFTLAARGHLEQLLDERLKGYVPDNEVIEIARVALWCIQEEISSRPSMTRVVQMLQGNIQVRALSSSSLQSLRLHASMAEVIIASQNTSSVASAESCQNRALLSTVELSV